MENVPRDSWFHWNEKFREPKMSIKVMPLMLRLLTDIMRQLMCVREFFFPFYPDRLWYTFTAMARIPSKYIVKVTFLHSRGSEYNVINRK